VAETKKDLIFEFTHSFFFDRNRWSGAAIEHAQQIDTDAEQESQFHVEYQTCDERGGKRY
jgi:hypothetical protein